ncbi:MAG TPA: iron dependent repressor, metal binding and dimerization domain protein [Actinomycetota bacterium]|nr:iron dependent repressor, metal binding and dimerization domain protein [Actinomycetota bacterium]
MSSELIDTTEMYLRTVFELEEEGTVPLRARIAERLGQSGPTVSQTVARMERDGLVVVSGDRHLELTPAGRAYATSVMRKHRLAECLLVNVIGLPWEDVHPEACRWEHVMSDAVEKRIWDLLDRPTTSPYGNPIPGLAGLGADAEPDLAAGPSLRDAAGRLGDTPIRVRIRRLDEPLQTEHEVLAALRRAGATPGATVKVTASPGGLLVGSGGEYAEVSLAVAEHIAVDPV